MFDITKSLEIYYGDDQSVILFQDHTASETWYMVPVPRLREVGGQPAFNLTQYTKETGDTAGLCTFEVELYYPEEARKAAEEQIARKEGDPIVWGQFTWVGGDAYFSFDLEGDAELVAVAPTLFGSNVAAFQIELGSLEDVKSFINAFSGDGSVSPFHIEYEMVVLTDLLGAKATLSYNSTAAIEYEKKYETRTDTWGNEKQVLVKVKQVLKRSSAGTVDVQKGVGGTDEVVQRVRDWAWTTLEQQVAADVAVAQAMATVPYPVPATSSFTREYKENAIIEWTTPVSGFLPKFDAETWRNVFSTVDNRQLAVTFALAGELFKSDGEPSFEYVEVTVDYPTKLQDNTFILRPGDNNAAAKTYIAPGNLVGDKFDPSYRYKYVVYYASGSPYDSGWIDDSQTRVSLRPADFGLSQVSFIGSNVPFKTGSSTADPNRVVEKVLIDFFFTPPEGNEARVKSKEMTANGDTNAVLFTSSFNAPVGAEYTYRLRYQMESGKIIVVQPESRFGGDNADVVKVLTPLDLITIVNLRAYNVDPEEGSAIELLEVNAQYYDVQNDGDTALERNDWSFMPEPEKGIQTADPSWAFQGTPNPDVSYFKYAGTVLYADGEDFQLDNYIVPANRKSLILYSDSYAYSVKIDTLRVDWTLVEAVYVNLFQYEISADQSVDALANLPSWYLKPWHRLNDAQRAEMDNKRVNVQRFDLLAAVKDAPVDDFDRYYNIRRRKSEKQVVFLYNADYVMKDGNIKTIPNDTVDDKLQISLPPEPPGGPEGKPLLRVISSKDLPAARKRSR